MRPLGRPPRLSLRLTRREALGVFGAAGAVSLLGCVAGGEAITGPGSTCVVTPVLTEGPFFVDERLERSDITGGEPGLPLTLALRVHDSSSASCSPLAGAQVDVWHASTGGLYSDVASLGSAGATFLRGHQFTDASGAVTFRTVYPGWYRGRATHIHVKVRQLGVSGSTLNEATTQIFFDDAVTDQVYAANPEYSTRGERETRNASDGIFGGRSVLLATLDGSAAAGFTGSLSIGVAT